MAIVLIGKIGSGKTTLYNKLTKSNENVQAGGDSVTMNVFMKQSCQGQGFKVLDTPGFGSDSQKVDHVAGVLAALSEGPLSRIMIVTRFDRTPNIFNEVMRMISPFMNFRVMITVVVTCWDECPKDKSDKNKKDIKDRLGQIQINSVLYVGKQDTAESICNQIDQIIANSQAQNVTLSEEEIFKKFDLTEYDVGELFSIDMAKQELLEKYHAFFQAAIKCIDETTCPKEILPDFTYALTQFSKAQADATLLEFEKGQLKQIDNLTEINKLRGFQLQFELKQTLFKEYENIVQHAQKKTNTNTQFAQFLKKCNYCDLIWLKVAGCSGGTVCGKLVEGASEQIDQPAPPQKFEFSYIGQKLKYVQKAVVLGAIDQEKVQKNLERNETNKKLIVEMDGVNEKVRVGGEGCKKIIYWDKMLNLTEKELIDVLAVMDKKLQEYLQQQSDLMDSKTKNQQIQYKTELEKKIKEQAQILKQNTK